MLYIELQYIWDNKYKKRTPCVKIIIENTHKGVLMNNITQIIEYRKSVIKHAKNKGIKKTLEEFKVSRATIYRWIKKFDGTNKSLLDKSRRPHSHLNQHIEEELRNIRN